MMRLGLVLVLVAQVLSQSRGGPLGTITGKLTRDGTPLAGARVVAVATSKSSGSVAIAALSETDPDGGYRLEDLPPGRYHVLAGALSLPTYYPGVAYPDEAAVVTVATGETRALTQFSPIDFSRVQVRARGRLTRVVTPLQSQIQVSAVAQASDGSAISRVVTAQPDGSFEFTNLPPGSYVFEPLRSRDFAGVFAKTPVEVRNRDVDGIELAMSAEIVGRVRWSDDGNGGPADRALRDTLIVARRESSAAYSVMPGPNGFFGYALEPDAYWFSVDALPFGYALQSISAGSVDLRNAPLVVDGSGNATEIDVVFAATPAAATEFHVRGRVTNGVTGDASSGTVRLQTEKPGRDRPSAGETGPMRWGAARIGPDGRYEIGRVPPGTYELIHELAGVSLVQTEVTVADHDANVSFRTSKVIGRVVTLADQPMPERVRLRSMFQAPDGDVEAAIKPDGTFVFPDVPATEYDLNVAGRQEVVNFVIGRAPPDLEIRLKSSVAVRIVMGDGSAVPSSFRILNTFTVGSDRDQQLLRRSERAVPQADGRHRMPVVAGEQTLSVHDSSRDVYPVRSVAVGSDVSRGDTLKLTGSLPAEIVVVVENLPN
ncbi:MAG TPA: carboxypeptidase regulatory-like domain-containing protein [Terriglobia bacterium]|nr:carboxypeptidase regulatory-like domain-containing protein [Terriglobia bacterium]